MNDTHLAATTQRKTQRRLEHEKALRESHDNFLRTTRGARLECLRAFEKRDQQVLKVAKEELKVVNWYVLANELGVPMCRDFNAFQHINREIRDAYLACHPEAMYRAFNIMDDWEAGIQQASVVAILDGKSTLIWEIR